MIWTLDRTGSKPKHWYRYSAADQAYELLVIVEGAKQGTPIRLSATLSALENNHRVALARKGRLFGQTDSFRSLLYDLKDWATSELKSPMEWLDQSLRSCPTP